MERRLGIPIIVMGHLGAGKTTLINRIRRIIFNMDDTKSTDCIEVIKTGGIRLNDGLWIEDIKETGISIKHNIHCMNDVTE